MEAEQVRLTRRTFMAAGALSLTNVTFGQTKKKSKKRIVFIAGPDSHGYGEHEHIAGCKLLADRLNALPNIKAEVIKDKWPDDDAILFSADAVVMYSDGMEKNVTDGHKDAFRKLTESKVGLGIMHYALFPPKLQYKEYMQATGGFFQPNWSVNPIWKPTFEKIPKHPITNGVRPFSVRDEWYYHMRFARKRENLTMLLSDLPPANTLIRPDGPYSNNTHVRKAVFGDKQPQHLAWACQRDNGRRGFGFTGGHFHWNWAQDDYRTLVLNAVAWLAGIEIPFEGIPSETPTYEELTGNLGPMPENTDTAAIKKLLADFKK
jgi:hypothetical protein